MLVIFSTGLIRIKDNLRRIIKIESNSFKNPDLLYILDYERKLTFSRVIKD
jgi:hypothetical protein